MTERETTLLSTLSATADPATRNAAAIELADLRSSEGMARIRALLHDPATAGERGSLLYALREADTKLGLAELVDIMLMDAPEASEEAFSFIERGLVDYPTAKSEQTAQLDRLRRTAIGGADEDRRSLARDALDELLGEGVRRAASGGAVAAGEPDDFEIKVLTTDTRFVDDISAAGIPGLKAAYRADMAYDSLEHLFQIAVAAASGSAFKAAADWIFERAKKVPPRQIIINNENVQSSQIINVVNVYLEGKENKGN